MPTLTSRGNAPRNPFDKSSIRHAAAALAAAADALSKVSEAIDFASQALSSSIHVLSALEGLNTQATQAATLSYDTLQSSDVDEYLQLASLVEAFSETQEDIYGSEHRGKVAQDDIAVPLEDPLTASVSSVDGEGKGEVEVEGEGEDNSSSGQLSEDGSPVPPEDPPTISVSSDDGECEGGNNASTGKPYGDASALPPEDPGAMLAPSGDGEDDNEGEGEGEGEGEDNTSTGQPSEDASPYHNEPIYESNNKRDSDFAPPSPGFEILTSSSGAAPQINYNLKPSKRTTKTKAVDTPGYSSAEVQSYEFSDRYNLEGDAVKLATLMAAYPKLPLGCNYYIQLNQELDEISVAAYMALQSTKTIFILHKPAGSQWSFFATVFTAITGLVVFHPEETSSLDSIQRAFLGFKAVDHPAILILPHDALQCLLLASAAPDCIVHWAVPQDMQKYIQQMYMLQLPIRACLMLPWVQGFEKWHWEMTNYGVVQFPDLVLQTCFGPTSPFQMVRNVSAQILDATNRSSCANHSTASGTSSAVLSTTVPVPQTGPELPNFMPAGHYYIVLDAPNNTDIALLISYIALRSLKTVCYIPPDRGLEKFRSAIETVTNLKTVGCGSKIAKKLKQFQSPVSGVLLRPTAKLWNSHLNKSMADSLIYWGSPPRINEYLTECSQKVNCSYLVLTRSQYQQIVPKKGASRFPLKVLGHPSPVELRSPPQGSLLYTLRVRLASYRPHI